MSGSLGIPVWSCFASSGMTGLDIQGMSKFVDGGIKMRRAVNGAADLDFVFDDLNAHTNQESALPLNSMLIDPNYKLARDILQDVMQFRRIIHSHSTCDSTCATCLHIPPQSDHRFQFENDHRFQSNPTTHSSDSDHQFR